MQNRVKQSEAAFERLLAGAFRRPSWRVLREPSQGDARPDLIVEGEAKKYLIAFQKSSEGRGDRLIPLLSQAILEARACAERFPQGAVPVAVVGARRVPRSVAENVKRFASRVASNMAIGVIDLEGLRAFAGQGLEVLNANASRPSRPYGEARRQLPHLFSDLNQWMLKVLLARRLPENLLAAPREQFRDASQLARAADVSVMTASRFVRQLENEGFLERREDRLEVVRIQELLRRWAGADRRPVHEIPVRWIIKKDRHQFYGALKALAGRTGKVATRTCIGLFAAADALGLGFVHGVPPYIYLETGDADVLRQLGLSAQDAGHSPDAFVRVPHDAETVFRPAVERDGVPVSDILQVWLDVAAHPSRGPAQANEIRRRVLGPLFAKK